MSNKNPFNGATFAERLAAREGKPAPDAKQVDDESAAVEDKAIGSAESKRTTRKKS